MKYQISIILLAILLFTGCTNTSEYKHQANLSEERKPEINIKRYEQSLFKIDIEDLKNELKKIQPEFPIFLNTNLDDTLKLIQMYNYLSDPFLITLFEASQNVFPDLINQEQELIEGFGYYAYYYPEDQTPKLYTYISGVDPNSPVIGTNGSLLISLDNYLGRDYETYKKMSIPNYKRLAFSKEYLPIDVFKELAYSKIKMNTPPRTLLDHMIFQGKLIYFTDLMFPDYADSLKIKYPNPKLEWCKDNEKNIWALLIENQLLYSTDQLVIRDYIDDAPYTKGFAEQSPGRIGTWIGWQIVKAYMNNHRDEHPEQLFNNENAQDVLKRSGYKP